MMYAGCSIVWTSKMQMEIALSTMLPHLLKSQTLDPNEVKDIWSLLISPLC